MNTIAKAYDLLFRKYGDLNWWPAGTPFEVMVGAILTQNTNWTNVEKALKNLADKDLLNPLELMKAPEACIAELIKPSGYYNQKAKKIKHFLEWFQKKASAKIEYLFNISTEELREGLLSIKGIGPETADDILLYALDRPVFVVDAYTYRIAVRHGWVPSETSYDELSSLFKDSLSDDIFIFKNYHAAIVETGKTFCRKKKPFCGECPLRKILPNGKPLEIERD